MLPERHVFVCNSGKCCAERGSAEVYAEFRARLKSSGLKPRVMVTGCGSIGFCDRGVAVAIYPEQVWYSRVTVADVEEIWTEHVVNGRVVARLVDQLDQPDPGVGPVPFQG
jgi:(2Fe-2S) ferredoxin